MTSKTYSIRDLLRVGGIEARTLRHWIRRKVLPAPLGRGRGARYTEDHVLRVRVIRTLRAQRLGLDVIRRQLSGLDHQQLEALLPRARPGAVPDAAPPPPPAPSYPAVSWEVIALFDGLVLMVNPGKGAVVRRIAEDIYRHYGVPAARPA
jgi:DNA-binding transcriptional MerR regulator